MLLLILFVISVAILVSIDRALNIFGWLFTGIASALGFFALLGFLTTAPGLIAAWLGVGDLAVTAIMVKITIIAAALVFTGGKD